MIPETFWHSMSSFITVVSVCLTIWTISVIYKNIVSAHRKNIYNTVEYNDCVIEKVKEDR